MDWGILICSLALLAIGLVALMSATQNSDYTEIKKQIQWFFISIPIIILVVSIDYEVIAKFSPVFYGIFILLLIGVLFTEPINGARSWYDLKVFQFQPAEFAKVFVILFLAYIMTKIQEWKKDEINRPTRLLLVLLALAVPMLLIIKQPDFGTAMAFLVAISFMLFVSGIKKRYIISSIAIVVISVPLAYMYILPDHAKKRIDVFLDPTIDPRGSRIQYNTVKISNRIWSIIRNGYIKGKSNSTRISTS